jgi:hypothetical protein
VSLTARVRNLELSAIRSTGPSRSSGAPPCAGAVTVIPPAAATVRQTARAASSDPAAGRPAVRPGVSVVLIEASNA